MFEDELYHVYPEKIASKILMYSHNILSKNIQAQIQSFTFIKHRRRTVYVYCPFCDATHRSPKHFSCQY